eukprot:403339776
MEMTSCIGGLVDMDTSFFNIQDHENTQSLSFKSTREIPTSSSSQGTQTNLANQANQNFGMNHAQQHQQQIKRELSQTARRQRSSQMLHLSREESKNKEIQEQKRKQLKKIMDKDIKCSICLHMYVKPISLVCGHTFCQLCIFKYFLNNTKNCPLCRRQVNLTIEEFAINIVLDSLSRKVNPEKYMKILQLNTQEFQSKKIMQRLQVKFDKNYIPTAYERFIWIINMLFPYFKTIKIVMTIFTPILILIWYAKNFKEVSKRKQQGITLMKDLQNDNIFYISNTIDLNYYETLLVRVSQLLFSLFGF